MFQREIRRALAREFGRIGKGGLNVRFLNRWIAADNFVAGDARDQVVENHGNHDARATDTRLSVTDCRVNCDPLLPVDHASFYLAVHGCPTGSGAIAPVKRGSRNKPQTGG